MRRDDSNEMVLKRVDKTVKLTQVSTIVLLATFMTETSGYEGLFKTLQCLRNFAIKNHMKLNYMRNSIY